MKIFRYALFCLLAVSTLTGAGRTQSISLSGVFTQDDQREAVTFLVSGPTPVTLRTFGFGGGVNAQGQTIAAGGFDPFLSLFSGSGALLDTNDDDLLGTVNPDPVTGDARDSLIQINLNPGTYTVVLTQFENEPNGATLSEGFGKTGQPTYTSAFVQTPGVQAPFVDLTGVQRTGRWALDILGVSRAPDAVPEPTGGLVVTCAALPLLGLIAVRRRKS